MMAIEKRPVFSKLTTFWSDKSHGLAYAEAAADCFGMFAAAGKLKSVLHWVGWMPRIKRNAYMHDSFAEAKAEALSYVLLAVVLILACFALWSHWSIASLSVEEAVMLGGLVRGAPALLALIAVPLLLWAIHCSSRQLLRVMRKHRLIFSLVVAGMCGIFGSALWLLVCGNYQWGTQDSVLVKILLVPVFVFGLGAVACGIATLVDKSAAKR